MKAMTNEEYGVSAITMIKTKTETFLDAYFYAKLSAGESNFSIS